VTPAALPEASTPAVTLTSASADSSTSAPTPVASDAAASASRTQSTGLEGTLVFQTGQGGTIYAYDLETGDLRALTNGFDPAISPDGTTVAFGRVGNNAGLYLIDIDGSNERQIYSGPPVVASPKWNTDGTQLLFAYATSARECRDMGSGNCVSEEKFEQGRYSDLDPNDYALITLYTYDVGVVDVNGDGFHSLSALNTVRAPDWAPDGIVYQSFDGIQIMSTQGNDSRVILYDALKPVDQDPDWAGERIVFQRPGASHWEIWTADANGATLAALTQPQTVLVDQLPSNVSPAYSPDGSQIAFVSNRTDSGEAGAWRIWMMNADGSNQRALPIDVEINYTFGAEQMVSWGG
jgi:Tol biopolymer transport system component